MLDYSRQRAIEALQNSRRAVLATGGPAGVHVGEFPCEAAELDVYLLIPQTSDHLFNLEHAADVSLLTAEWELQGEAHILSADRTGLRLSILQLPGAEWCALVRVTPRRLQIRRAQGWGNVETIDFGTR